MKKQSDKKVRTRPGMRKLTKGEINEVYRTCPEVRQMIIKYAPLNQ